MKKIIKKHFENFVWFYNYLSNRLFLSLALSILIGLLDGISLTMFIPLLQMVSDPLSSSSGGLGKLDFIFEWIDAFVIEMNFDRSANVFKT